MGFKYIRINYSQDEFEGVYNISPCGLLTETGISPWKPETGNWDELPVVFANDNPMVPFDIFSAIFYLVTRYEEYLPFKPDQYGRFQAEESVAFKNGFLRLPIVELWCRKLAEVLKIECLCCNLSESHYRFRLTIDIDHPWLFKNKGWFYAAGSLLRELARFNISQFRERLSVLTGRENDPGDTYNFLATLQPKINEVISYFVLCRKSGGYDNNRSVKRKALHRLVKWLDINGKVGIHPSFVSNTNDSILDKEIAYLSKILERDILFSRQHYLCLSFPDTYYHLILSGINEDYSMGYSSQTGFRAGIARSFNFFDLQNNRETELRIYPFQIMDRTLLSYMKLSPDEAEKEFEYYYDITRNVGGEFICLWHNDSLSDWGEWKGWKKVFEKMVNLNSKHDPVPEK